ncbi:hypothetical protein [Brevundimonas sp. NIBR10]|uniref:hypothetical protein n=1 Tax=Brevundimonas sp. NIBR10 TaxID=3015997 RepID=UPI0022F1A29F|nr:hypothetical protein [Brevundimonas sp. NIBR10]
MFDIQDALEDKLRLGVLASSMLEGARIACSDVSLLTLGAVGSVLRRSAGDFQAPGCGY